jgi:hypothetical protein
MFFGLEHSAAPRSQLALCKPPGTFYLRIFFVSGDAYCAFSAFAALAKKRVDASFQAIENQVSLVPG